ncbi:MAG: hypothetical protein FJW39_01225 [Acidobacteria bacterium]|nr:hypothetical protein [Acidobacteriota bacterium]
MAQQHGNGHSVQHHVAPVIHYVGVWLLLMLLTGLTVAVATVDFGGSLNTVVALAVAGVKATAVIWIFMEVRHAQPLTKLSVITGIFFLVILLVFTFGDYFGRSTTFTPLEEGWRSDGPHSVGTVPELEPKPAHAPAKGPAKH